MVFATIIVPIEVLDLVNNIILKETEITIDDITTIQTETIKDRDIFTSKFSNDEGNTFTHTIASGYFEDEEVNIIVNSHISGIQYIFGFNVDLKGLVPFNEELNNNV